MKNKFLLIVLIITLFFTIISWYYYFNSKKDNIPYVWIDNTFTWWLNNSHLWDLKIDSWFSDIDKEKFKKDMKKIDNTIYASGWVISFEQIVEKARLQDYLWEIWKSIKLYEENFNLDNNSGSIVYNHNMAKLYERVKEYNLALERYKFLIEKMNNFQYFRDVAMMYKNSWDDINYKKYIDLYNKYYINQSAKDFVEIK